MYIMTTFDKVLRSLRPSVDQKQNDAKVDLYVRYYITTVNEARFMSVVRFPNVVVI